MVSDKQWIEELTEEQKTRIKSEFHEDSTHMIIHRNQEGKLVADIIKDGYVSATVKASLVVTPGKEKSSQANPIFVDCNRTIEDDGIDGESQDE